MKVSENDSDFPQIRDHDCVCYDYAVRHTDIVATTGLSRSVRSNHH